MTNSCLYRHSGTLLRQKGNMTKRTTQAAQRPGPRMLFRSLVLLGTMSIAAAQTGNTGSSPISGGPITMSEVVQTALRDYPLIHVTQEELNASAANIQL